ncbi:hypothetical protein [Cupriavidus necator]|uniref:hypothetical protein n=1 Tax=Cupriavidus necator TaxID=106590 RepID=UPI000A4868D7|nr:hypothetical protein [Cupriavidus necator]
MEEIETRSTYNTGFGSVPQQEPTFGERASGDTSRRQEGSSSSSAKSAASQELARELDRLLDRLPGLSGESLEQAKAEFVERAAKSGRTAAELAAKSADVARRMTGIVKNEWEVGRERAETLVHANPISAVGVALGVGVLLGAILFGSSRHGGEL